MSSNLPTLKEGEVIRIVDSHGEWEFVIEEAQEWYGQIPARVDLKGTARRIDDSSEAAQRERFEKGENPKAG